MELTNHTNDIYGYYDCWGNRYFIENYTNLYKIKLYLLLQLIKNNR